jgi:hypothetical protein
VDHVRDVFVSFEERANRGDDLRRVRESGSTGVRSGSSTWSSVSARFDGVSVAVARNDERP